MDITQLNKQIQKLSLDKMTAKNVKENNEEFTDLLRDQMREGRKADGLMNPLRDIAYARAKKNYRAPFPTRDLYDTGSFQNKLYGKVKGQNMEFDSRDSKAFKIRVREGDEVFIYDDAQLDLAQALNEGLIVEQIANIFK